MGLSRTFLWDPLNVGVRPEVGESLKCMDKCES